MEDPEYRDYRDYPSRDYDDSERDYEQDDYNDNQEYSDMRNRPSLLGMREVNYAIKCIEAFPYHFP